MKLIVLSLLVVAAVAAAPAGAVVWHVAPDGSGDAPTVRAAAYLAAAGDTVELACGTYYEHDITLPVAITLCSVDGDPGCATIDAQHLGRVLVCADLGSEVVCRGITFANGNVTGDYANGGAIHCYGGTLRLEDCHFVGNHARASGGALNGQQCQITLADCRFVGNQGEGGGGAIRFTEVEGAIRRCWFEGNSGIDGAGLFLSASSPAIEWCVFLNNDGRFFGGAMFCQVDASPSIDHCTLVGNDAYLGSCIMTAADAIPTMTHCIVAYNVGGPALHCDDGYSSPSYLDLSCSDVFGNPQGSYSGWLEDQTGLNGNLAEDPLFCDQVDLALSAMSPCLPANNACGQLMGAVGQGCSATPVEPTPAAREPLAVRPNPFNPRTTLSFSLAAAGPVQVAIYDLRGRELIRLLDDTLAAGAHAVVWAGQDEGGAAMPSGTYFCRLTTPAGVEARKLQLVR